VVLATEKNRTKHDYKGLYASRKYLIDSDGYFFQDRLTLVEQPSQIGAAWTNRQRLDKKERR
jgi:hypothetical protein